MITKDIILIGGGGHCISCIDVIESTGLYRIAGIVDVKEKIGQQILGYKIIASDDELSLLSTKYKYYLVTVGQIKSPATRIKLTNSVKKSDFILSVIISPHAYISKHAVVGEGSIIMNRAVINANVKVGSSCIINTGAIVEYDSLIGDYCHVSINAVINGGVIVGNNCFIESNATLKESIKITRSTLVAAGVFVNKDCVSPGTYLGVPAKKLTEALLLGWSDYTAILLVQNHSFFN